MLDNVNSREISLILSVIRLKICRIDVLFIANIIGLAVYKQREINGEKCTSVYKLTVGYVAKYQA